MLVGYVRVSKDEQNLELQEQALSAVGCERLFTDKMTGSVAAAQRQGLREALSYLRPGDVLVVWKLDRLGRTTKGLIDMVHDLEVRHIEFRSLTESIDTSTGPGRFFFHVMAALYRFCKADGDQHPHADGDAAADRHPAGLVTQRRRRWTPHSIPHPALQGEGWDERL